MDHVRYGGTPYLNSNNVGWDHHSSTSWEERQDTFHSPHVQRSSLEEIMAELAKTRAKIANSRLEKNMAEMKRSQAELAMAQVAFSRSMPNMDYSQVSLPRSHVEDKIRSPLQETMTNL